MLTASDCTIKQFRRAWFHDDRSEMNDTEFSSIHTEYVDLSGMARTRQLELESQVQHLNNRVERVRLLLWQLRTSVTELSDVLGVFVQFKENIETLKSYGGYKLYWNNDAKEFEAMLQRIENREKRFSIQLEERQNDLTKFLQSQIKGDSTTLQTERMFIQNMNTLRKAGNPINQNDTYVDELALMIRSHNEEAELLNSKNENK